MTNTIRALLVLILGIAGNVALAADSRSPDDLAAARQEAIANPRLRIPAVFSGEKFPAIDFEQPALMRHLFGSYTINTTWYNVDQTQVAAPDQPGRYGLVVHVIMPDGSAFKRFYTSFRAPRFVGRPQWKIEGLGLPAELGIDPQIVAEQSGFLRETMSNLFGESLLRDPRGAAVLAGLYETKAGGGKLLQRNSLQERDQQWWYTLKRKTGDLKKLPCFQFVPEEYARDTSRQWPLIVFLHGSGERGDDLELIKVHGPPKVVQTRKDFPFLVLAPQCRAGEWFLPLEVMDLIDEFCTQHRVDRDRIYLTGLSMGGYGTWAVASQYPDRFAAIAPICGGGDPQEVRRIKDLPAWIFHGAKDPVVPLKRAEEMYEALKSVGGRVRLTVYPEAGHDSWTAAYASQELYDWFLKQRKGKPAEPSAASDAR